ncbi:MAG: hypothetical protein IPH20_19355 [Bacteroidales bacterium]|jgi:hypothetical protein|nr:hypothetical protein [Bacteroidales bacterium]
MKTLILILFVAIVPFAYGQQLPAGVTSKSFDCTYATGQSANYYYKGDEMIGMVEPSSCNYSETQGGRVNPLCYAEFYMTQQRDTFSTKKEATSWLIAAIEEYYKPVEITKWQKLKVQPPKVSLKYPWDWEYKLAKNDGIFQSKSQSENKLSLWTRDQWSTSEIFVIIRTPNTAKRTTVEVMEMTSRMNGAINLKANPPKDVVIGGKTFKSSRNEFMMQMDQYHFWYADELEIIYVNYNLLKNERIWYPEVMKSILESITW